MVIILLVSEPIAIFMPTMKYIIVFYIKYVTGNAGNNIYLDTNYE